MKRRTPRIHIRRAVATDAEAIASVIAESFAAYQAAYTPAAFTATTPRPDQIERRLHEGPMWIAVQRATIVGTLSAVPQDALLYLRSLAVLPMARGQGIGRNLLEQVEQFAVAHAVTRLVLSTTPFLAHAIQLYTQLGFQTSTDGPHDLFGTPLLTMVKLVVPVIETPRASTV